MSLATASRRHRKKKLKAEINVVPYIDVMLVLLIIFMVTAPLLNVGVDVNLPQANAKPLEQKQDPLVVRVGRDGSLGLVQSGRDRPEALAVEQLVEKVKAFTAANPELPVYVAGDREVSYQAVYEVMTRLQMDAKVSRVGLMGEPAAQPAKK